jgi:hypothetical protein
LKGACPDKRLPKGLLLKGKEAIIDCNKWLYFKNWLILMQQRVLI